MRSWARLEGVGAMRVVADGFWAAAAGRRNDFESLEARHALPNGSIANTHALCEPACAQRRGEILRGRHLATGQRGQYAVARAQGGRSPCRVSARLHSAQFPRWPEPLCHH